MMKKNEQSSGLHIGSQIAGRDINTAMGEMHVNNTDAVGQAQIPQAFIAELEKLKSELSTLKQKGDIGEEEALDTEHQINKAIMQAKKSTPDKKTILEHLNTAKAFIENVSAASGMITAFISATEMVRKFFP